LDVEGPMAGSNRRETQTAIKRDPLSKRGGKVPTSGSVATMRPPAGGSKPPAAAGSGNKK
jgi:hypothetical protein